MPSSRSRTAAAFCAGVASVTGRSSIDAERALGSAEEEGARALVEMMGAADEDAGPRDDGSADMVASRQ